MPGGLGQQRHDCPPPHKCDIGKGRCGAQRPIIDLRMFFVARDDLMIDKDDRAYRGQNHQESSGLDGMHEAKSAGDGHNLIKDVLVSNGDKNGAEP